MTLTGGVQVTDAGKRVVGRQVVMEQQSGDGVAEGAVKVSYVQPKSGAQATASGSSGSDDVAHVLAARAELKRAADLAIFYGEAGRAARLVAGWVAGGGSGASV